MSIATLKKKTEQKYHCMSVERKQFSLNGGSRNQGYVGQSNLMRRFPMTHYRGDTARGNGGCCGTYRQTNIVSGINYQNEANIIKPSVVGTNGMLATKYRWIRRPQPFSATKPDVNMNLKEQSNYIANLKKTTLTKINGSLSSENTKPTYCPCKFTKEVGSKFTKEVGSKTQGNYLISLDKRCDADCGKPRNLPVNISGVPVV